MNILYLYNNGGFFFLLQTNRTKVTIPMLYQTYKDHRDVFNEHAYNVKSTQPNVHNLDQLFASLLNSSASKSSAGSHHLWRINRLLPARILRKIFAKPFGLPETAGIGMERFVAIDTPLSKSYALPETDCSNMFVLMAKGSRTIRFIPTIECQMSCRSLTFHLHENTFCKFAAVLLLGISL